jgi:hypothetical protein
MLAERKGDNSYSCIYVPPFLLSPFHYSTFNAKEGINDDICPETPNLSLERSLSSQEKNKNKRKKKKKNNDGSK